MMMMMKPSEPNKPTAWLKGLDLKSRHRSTIIQLERDIKEQMADPNKSISVLTEYVTKNKSIKKSVKRWVNSLTDNPIQLLDIIPIGGICLCHTNTQDAVSIMNRVTCMSGLTFREAVGYNLMSCQCGAYHHGEIHSVIYCNEKGCYYDVTEDMFGEEKKWFVEVPELTKKYNTSKFNKHRHYDLISNSEGCRKCYIRNMNGEYEGDLKNIKEHYA